jgi:hypothetical protein
MSAMAQGNESTVATNKASNLQIDSDDSAGESACFASLVCFDCGKLIAECSHESPKD